MRRTTPKLKVYQARFGFHDSVVAAQNQAMALRAWGVGQNLFTEGEACITTDPAAVEAAMAHPDTPLVRPFGSDHPFSLPAAATVVAPAKGRGEANPPATKPRRDKAALRAAEGRLRDIEAAQAKAEADLRRRRAEFDAEESAVNRDWATRRAQARAEVDRERKRRS